MERSTSTIRLAAMLVVLLSLIIQANAHLVFTPTQGRGGPRTVIISVNQVMEVTRC